MLLLLVPALCICQTAGASATVEVLRVSQEFDCMCNSPYQGERTLFRVFNHGRLLYEVYRGEQVVRSNEVLLSPEIQSELVALLGSRRYQSIGERFPRRDPGCIDTATQTVIVSYSAGGRKVVRIGTCGTQAGGGLPPVEGRYPNVIKEIFAVILLARLPVQSEAGAN